MQTPLPNIINVKVLSDQFPYSEMISIFAIIVSILAVIISTCQNQRTRDISLHAEYFRVIFDKYLIKKLPKLRAKISFKETNEIVGVDELCDELNNMRRDSQFFHYSNNTFYNKLVVNLQALEDCLVLAKNRKFSSPEQESFLISVQAKYNSIYSIIECSYRGSSIPK